MKCPHCKKEIDFVVISSYYYQLQRLDKSGCLIEEYEDINNAIGDTMFYLCPKCDDEIEFDRYGKIIVKNLIDETLSDYKFQVGDIVNVTPHEDDNFNHFVGRVDGHRYDFIIVTDQEDNRFDVHEWQLSLLFDKEK